MNANEESFIGCGMWLISFCQIVSEFFLKYEMKKLAEMGVRGGVSSLEI